MECEQYNKQLNANSVLEQCNLINLQPNQLFYTPVKQHPITATANRGWL